MTEKEKQRRNVHLSTEGYVIAFLVLMVVAFLLAKFVPLVGFILAIMVLWYALFNFPTLIDMWQKAEADDEERKKDRIF